MSLIYYTEVRERVNNKDDYPFKIYDFAPQLMTHKPVREASSFSFCFQLPAIKNIKSIKEHF